MYSLLSGHFRLTFLLIVLCGQGFRFPSCAEQECQRNSSQPASWNEHLPPQLCWLSNVHENLSALPLKNLAQILI